MQSVASSNRHLVCTIVTPNYLNQCLILGESLAKSMPSADLRVLVLQDCTDIGPIQDAIDGYMTSAQSGASHRALTIDDCDWGDFDIEAATLFYNILEFATSVKPALLRSFLGERWDRVTYLDPDIQVFDDFAPILDDLADLSLTPHLLSDIPRDDFTPSTHDVLMAGFFNLGFCSVRPSARPFLDWWSEQLQFECLNDHRNGYFTDQKIVDLAPLKANIQVVKDPGCNVAYWNLHERRIVADQGGWAVSFEGLLRRLYFFHFSGFRTDRNPSLSIHASRKVLGDAVPRAFANQYEQGLRGPAQADHPYPFTLGGASLRQPIPPSWNQALREDARVHVRAGLTLREVREVVYVPLDADRWSTCRSCGQSHDNFGTRAQSFLAGWACHPSLVGVPNAVSAFFRDPHFEYRMSPMDQLSWASRELVTVLAGNDELAAEVLRTAGRAVRDAADLKLVGYFSYPAGIGQIARWTLRTLEASDIHPAIDRVFAVIDSNDYLSALLRRRNPLAASNASVLCLVNADQWEAHVKVPQRVNVDTQHVEAVWAWELEQIPSQMHEVASSGDISRVHALSRWSADAMAKVLPVPVQRFAPFDVDLIDSLFSRPDDFERAGDRYLLTTFDAKSYLSRKNPEGAISLWNRVRADYPEHWLVIKSTDLRDFAPAELLDVIDSSDRIRLIDRHLADHEYAELLAGCDAFLSLHRSEGMGATPIEAGLCGLPVIYTNYGGVTDFLEDGFFPVSFSMVAVGESHHDTGPYDDFALWAEPDLDDAERQLRRALDLVASDEWNTALVVDRKQLAENLVAAQAEVVATAQRLLSRTQGSEQEDDLALMAELMKPPPTVTEPPAPPTPNRLLFIVVAVAWSLYRILPRGVRLQVNIALNNLRGKSERRRFADSSSDEADAGDA